MTIRECGIASRCKMQKRNAGGCGVVKVQGSKLKLTAHWSGVSKLALPSFELA
jgi:hypothetical protein